MKIDADGRVKLWLIDQQKWGHRYATDAREILRAASGSLAGPVVEVRKGKKAEMVCEEQVAAFESDGWKRVSPPPPAAVVADPADAGGVTAPPVAPPASVDFTTFDEAQLGTWLSAAVPSMDAADIASMTKPQLIEQLERVNFVPPASA